MAGKGDRERPKDYQKWSNGYDLVFGREVEIDTEASVDAGSTPAPSTKDEIDWDND